MIYTRFRWSAVLLGAAIATSPALLRGQPESAATLSFEVASVKPHPLPPGQFVFRMGARSLQPHGDRFTEKTATLNDLIMDAYEVKEYQIAGSPQWAGTPTGDHFDIEAKAPGTPNASQLRQMLQNLLMERFSLKLHRETREIPVYVLVVGKGGSKLREMREDEKIPTYATRPAEAPKTMMGPISNLVFLLSTVVDRPILDQTGLTGRYEYTSLDFAQLRRNLRSTQPDADSGESVFSVVQRDLGLKLEGRKEPMEILVIDHVEKPTAN